MHFWIDKRSQCAYSGRHRVPSSISAGVGRGRTRVCVAAGGARKGMAAPVHRFAAVDCPPRRPHRTHRHYNPPASSTPSVHGQRRQDSLYVEIGDAPPTIASLAAARSVTPDTLLRTAALGLQQSPMMAPHLKFGMLVSFALATVFLAGAKYYFDRQMIREGGVGGPGGGGGGGGRGPGAGGEAGVVCAAVACVCGVGCALSLCRARAPPALLQPDRVTSTAHRDPPQPPSEPSDDISLATLLGPSRPIVLSPRLDGASGRVGGGGGGGAGAGSEAPPPYNIAVLMPARQGPDPPPPAYSALS